MKKIKILIPIFVSFLMLLSCNKEEEKKVEGNPVKTDFNTNDYSEYLTCVAGDYAFATGNSTNNTTSITAFKIGSTLYLTSSDGNFVSGAISPMEINMQLKNFDPVNPKSYEVSADSYAEILKFKHVDGANYDSNSGIGTVQTNAIKITTIKNGFYSGSFSFTCFDQSNRKNTLSINKGTFLFYFQP